MEWDICPNAEDLTQATHADIFFIDNEVLEEEGFLGLAMKSPDDKTPPIVLFLEKDDWEGEARAASMGIAHCLIKGRFDHSRLQRMVRFALERKKVVEELRFKNLHFSWTGLPNRRMYLSHLQSALHSQKNSGSRGFVSCLIDIDKFGRFNDAFGFSSGDQLLLHTSNRLRTALNGKAFLAHSSADQFLCLWDSVEELSEVTEQLNQIEREFKKPVILNGQEVLVHLRCGLVHVKHNYTHPEIILRDAARACDRTRGHTEGIYTVYEPEALMRSSRLAGSEADLRRALNREELELFYQPLLALPHDQIEGFEVLVRWHHPSRGMLMPADFLPLADQSGLSMELGEYILHTACAQAKTWEVMGFDKLQIHLNLSLKQFYQADILRCIRDGLSKTSVLPRQLTLEITESTLMSNLKSSLPRVRELSEFGVGMALDNFGTGQSSLVSLRQFPLKALKIDGSFIRGITTHRDQRSIVQAILSLGKHLEKEVWAGAVETNSQLQFLSHEGCDGYQGYLVSPALTHGNFTKLLQKNKEKTGRHTLPV